MSVQQSPLPQQFHPLDDQGLRLSMWWLDHEGRVKLWLKVVIVGISCALIGFAVFTWMRYVFANRAVVSQLVRAGLPYEQWRVAHPLADIIVDDMMFIKSDAGNQVVWSATNQNSDYSAVVSFSLASAPNARGISFIRMYPGQKQWFGVGALSSVSQIDAGELTVSAEWERLKVEQKQTITKLSDITVEEIGYIPETGVALPGVRAVIQNTSVEGYWHARLAVIAFENNKVTGFTDISIEALKALEQRTEAFAWRGPALSSSALLEAAVYVDVLDEDIVMKTESP